MSDRARKGIVIAPFILGAIAFVVDRAAPGLTGWPVRALQAAQIASGVVLALAVVAVTVAISIRWAREGGPDLD